jgi:NAD(P)-dependent dehydrogenase (short-subunit alcohol dehydrogenase family)
MELNGAAAVVSGGASGLGEATARALAAAGAIVTVADIDEERGGAVAADIGGLYARADVADDSMVARAIEMATHETGNPLRIAVSCAGIGYAGRIVNRAGEPHSLDVFQRVLAVNLVGTFNVMRLAAAAMMKSDPMGPDGERGLLVNTASVAALEGQTGQVAYAAAKGGIVAMTLPAARDLAVAGIRVCTIVPGTMDTPLFGRASVEMKASLAKDVLFPKRMGTPAEFGELTVALARNSYMNAEVVRIDGGLRMPAK